MDWLTPELLADGIEALVYAINYDNYEIIFINRASRDVDPSVQIGAHCYEVFFENDKPCDHCPFTRLQSTGRRIQSVKWISRFNKWLNVVYSDLQLKSGEHACMVTGLDVTAMQEALASTQRVLDSIHAAAYTIDTNSYRLYSINHELRNMLPNIQIGDLCHKALWDNPMPCSFCPLITTNNDENNENKLTNLELYNAKLKKHLSIDMVRMGKTNGRDLAIFTGYDISHRIESESKIRDMAYTDPLSGLQNRLAFTETLTRLFENGNSGCLCIMNIKNIRQYNLMYGKSAGDTLLKSIANLCSSYYMKSRCYRISGAKYAFLAEDEQQAQLLRKVATEASKNFLDNWDNPGFNLYFSVIFLDFPMYANSPEQAIYNADFVLHKNARKEGNERLEFGKPQEEMLNRGNRIEEILRNKAFEGRMSVHYQPIYDIKTNSYSKCEALIRMWDEQLGFISPAELIPLAEQSGYIGDIGKFVLNEVCAFLASRAKRGLPLIKININVSAIDFAHNGFCNDVISIVEKWDVSPEWIQLELTESVYMNSVDIIVKLMKRLIEYGFSFAIDDFGTGYSNLSYIGGMPIECLKLDKSFMDMMLESDPHRLIVANVIELAKDLKLSIVAEGIESEKQYQMIKELGGDYIQGFLFSKPLSDQDFEKFIDTAHKQ